MVATGTRIFDERSSPGDVSGSPGAGRASPVLPALVKASRARIAIGINRETDPAASNEGSSLRQQKAVARHEQSHDLVRGLKPPGYQQW
jgi:hypothetical protein